MAPASTGWLVVSVFAGSLLGIATTGGLLPLNACADPNGVWSCERGVRPPQKGDRFAECRGELFNEADCRRLRALVDAQPPAEEPAKLYSAADELYQVEDYEGAKALLIECVRRDARHRQCHLLLGLTYGQLGDSHLEDQEYAKFAALSKNAGGIGQLRGDIRLDATPVAGE